MSNIEYSLEGARSDVTLGYEQPVLPHYSPHLKGLIVGENDMRTTVSSSETALSHRSLCGLLLREAGNGAAALDDMVVKCLFPVHTKVSTVAIAGGIASVMN